MMENVWSAKFEKKAKYKTVRVIIVDFEGNIFLQKKKASSNAGEAYELPGGKVGPKQTKRDAAAREVDEETGLDVRKISKYLGLALISVGKFKYNFTHNKKGRMQPEVEVYAVFLPKILPEDFELPGLNTGGLKEDNLDLNGGIWVSPEDILTVEKRISLNGNSNFRTIEVLQQALEKVQGIFNQDPINKAEAKLRKRLAKLKGI